MMNQTRKKLAFACSMVIFGTIGILRKYIPLPSGFIAMARGLVGTLFLAAVMLLTRKRLCFSALKKKLPLLFASGTALGFNWILLFEAYGHTTVAVATLCYYMAPVLLILLSVPLFHEKLTPLRAVCSVLAVLGMVLVSGVLSPGALGGDAAGILLGLGAAVLYTCVMVLNRYLSDLPAYDKTVVQLGTAAVVLLPYTLIFEDFSGADFSPLSVGLLLTAAVIHTGVAYALYFGSVAALPAHTVAIFSYIDPVLAVFLSALWLHEKTDLAGVLGAVLILGATAACEILPALSQKKENNQSSQ